VGLFYYPGMRVGLPNPRFFYTEEGHILVQEPLNKPAQKWAKEVIKAQSEERTWTVRYSGTTECSTKAAECATALNAKGAVAFCSPYYEVPAPFVKDGAKKWGGFEIKKRSSDNTDTWGRKVGWRVPPKTDVKPTNPMGLNVMPFFSGKWAGNSSVEEFDPPGELSRSSVVRRSSSLDAVSTLLITPSPGPAILKRSERQAPRLAERAVMSIGTMVSVPSCSRQRT